jgi:hypothetical protein
MSDTLSEGWVNLMNARKYHYVRAGMALCRKWAYLGREFAGHAFGAAGPRQDDCAACWRAIESEKTP